MAKRKRRPGGGSKLRPIKDYRADEYVPYIASAETGILQAWTIHPDLRDGDVRKTLRRMMRTIKETDAVPPKLLSDDDAPTGSDASSKKQVGIIEHLILLNLRDMFDESGALTPEELVGILGVINHSVGTWNRGMRGQEYLKYIKDFLGGMGITVQQLTDEEAEAIGLIDAEDSDDSIEGEYHEIK